MTTQTNFAVPALKPAPAGIRVAQIIGSFGGGGAERAAFNFGAGLSRFAETSLCIAICNAGQFAQTGMSQVQVVELGVQRGSFLSMLKGMRRLRRVVRENRIDVLHIHGQTALTFCATALIGVPVCLCFTWHNSSEILTVKGWRRHMTLWSMSRCRALFGSSSKVTAALRAALPRHLLVETFRNGIVLPDDHFSPPSRQSAVPTILWMGRLVPDKDPLALLEAAAALRKSGLKFRVVIAGDCPPHLSWYKQQILDLIEKNDLTETVHLAGWIDDPSNLLEEASIGVQTSHTEGLSLALLEQMTYGLAVVATDVGDTRDPVIDGETGILIQPKDTPALVRALASLLEDPSKLQRIGAAAHRRILDLFSMDVVSRNAINTYSRLCRPDRRIN
jgi:glycosyltransferase involved in cell wall biosynthesis